MISAVRVNVILPPLVVEICHFTPNTLNNVWCPSKVSKDLSNNSRLPRKASAVIFITNGDVFLEDLVTFTCLAF